MSDLIKRGTKITPNLIQAVFLDIFHNVNQIPFSNLVLSSKQFNNQQGAYNDSVITGNTGDYLKTYLDYVNMLKAM